MGLESIWTLSTKKGKYLQLLIIINKDNNKDKDAWAFFPYDISSHICPLLLSFANKNFANSSFWIRFNLFIFVLSAITNDIFEYSQIATHIYQVVTSSSLKFLDFNLWHSLWSVFPLVLSLAFLNNILQQHTSSFFRICSPDLYNVPARIWFSKFSSDTFFQKFIYPSIESTRNYSCSFFYCRYYSVLPGSKSNYLGI